MRFVLKCTFFKKNYAAHKLFYIPVWVLFNVKKIGYSYEQLVYDIKPQKGFCQSLKLTRNDPFKNNKSNILIRQDVASYNTFF